MAEAGIEVTAKNKKQIDEAIHQMMGVNYKNCSATWRALKHQITGEQTQDFVRKLQDAIRS